MTGVSNSGKAHFVSSNLQKSMLIKNNTDWSQASLWNLSELFTKMHGHVPLIYELLVTSTTFYGLVHYILQNQRMAMRLLEYNWMATYQCSI